MLRDVLSRSKASLTIAFSFSVLNDDFMSFGFIIIGLFVTSWIVFALIYRLKRYGDMVRDSR